MIVVDIVLERVLSLSLCGFAFFQWYLLLFLMCQGFIGWFHVF